MGSTTKQFYYALPPRIQDFAISALGYRRRIQRFGGMWKRTISDLMSSQWWSAEQHRAAQLAKLHAIVDEAYQWCDYYRELMNEAGIHPADIRSLDDLYRFPMLEKETLRSRTSDFYNLSPRRKPTEWGQTSGSTGTPLTIPGDKESFSTSLALLAATSSGPVPSALW